MPPFQDLWSTNYDSTSLADLGVGRRPLRGARAGANARGVGRGRAAAPVPVRHGTARRERRHERHRWASRLRSALGAGIRPARGLERDVRDGVGAAGAVSVARRNALLPGRWPRRTVERRRSYAVSSAARACKACRCRGSRPTDTAPAWTSSARRRATTSRPSTRSSRCRRTSWRWTCFATTRRGTTTTMSSAGPRRACPHRSDRVPGRGVGAPFRGGSGWGGLPCVR